MRQLRIGRQLLADLLHDLLQQGEIRVVGNRQLQLVDDPVAAHVLHRAQRAEGYGVEVAAVVAQLDRAQALDRALVAAADDVLADPERVVEQVEDPRITSLTSVCAPKPTATPTTPAPAISGPICTPMADRAISAAMTRKTMNRMLRRIGRSVRIRERRLASLGSASPVGV